jgi:hypothetical protein
MCYYEGISSRIWRPIGPGDNVSHVKESGFPMESVEAHHRMMKRPCHKRRRRK